MLRYAVHVPGRKFVQAITGKGKLFRVFWTLDPELAFWWRSKKNAAAGLRHAQRLEPEAQLVERESLDL